MDDSEFLALARGGDERAFAELMTRHRDHSWAVCLKIVENYSDAEDALQEASLSAWRNLHHFRGEARFSTWLHRISVNSALVVVRRRREVLSGYRIHTELVDPAPLPADRVVDVDSVRRALAQIPEYFRAAIVLREVAGMTYAEIADHQQIGVGTVKTRISRARTSLVSMLAPAA